MTDPKSSAAVLNAIKARAISLWGESDWFPQIVKEYVRLELEQTQGDAKKATYANRRNQIERAFETGSCRLDTSMLLAAAVGCQFQLVCKEVQVMEF